MLNEFESSGGFLDGSYIWKFPNELVEDYNKRRAQARHHGYLESLVDVYVRHLFSQPPRRTTKSEGLKAFWANADGTGSTIDTFMRRAIALALVCGHSGVLVDATADKPQGPSRADQRARPFVTAYTAPAIRDWQLHKSTLLGVKLQEAAPDGALLADPLSATEAIQWLVWASDGWARFDATGDLIDGGVPGLGQVPFAVLRPKPSMLRPFLGRPLIANANLLKALFNRQSEHDQVIRDQAASLLTVEVNADGDVDRARKQLGSDYGTSRAVVVQGKVKYETPAMSVPEAVREAVKEITREIYRMAHMRFERDSLQAESAEAIRLQYTELNEMLQGVAAAAADVEQQLARFYFAWTEPTPAAAQAAYEAAHVTIEYADQFFMDDLETDLRAWAEAVAMSLGDTMTKRIKKRAVRRIEPEMPIPVLDAIDAEIDGMREPESFGTIADQLRTGATQRLAVIRAQQTQERAS